MAREHGQSFGDVTVAELDHGDASYEWRPGALIADALSTDYSITLRSVAVNGRRRFIFDAPDPTTFMLRAAIGGLYIRATKENLGEDGLQKQHFYRAYYQFVRHTRNFAQRRFTSCLDLLIKKRSRQLRERHVLPAALGRKGGRRWNIDRVLAKGNKALREAGRSRPRMEEVIRWGIWKGAELDPLFSCNAADVRTLVQMALFAGAEHAEVSPAQIDWVESEIQGMFKSHIDDDTEQFQKFLKDAKSNPLTRLAKRPWTPVGKLSRQQLNKALVEIGWRAILSLAACFDAQMREIQDSLPGPLTRWEKQQFELFYLRKRCFGNLPLFMLKERVGFAREALLDIFEAPNDKRCIAVFHRLLAYYPEMLEKRRAADREGKRRCGRTNKRGKDVVKVSLNKIVEPAQASTRGRNEEFREVAKYVLLRTRRAKEKLFSGDWDAQLIRCDDTIVEIQLTTSVARSPKQFSVKRATFDRLAREFRE